MKKLIYIFVILLTFSIGIIGFYLRPIIIPVSLCEISQHAEFYQFNNVRIKAYLDVSKDGNSVSIYELKKVAKTQELIYGFLKTLMKICQ